jgi:hypothetical protein
MSYYTDIEFTFADDPPDFEGVLERARLYLEARRDDYPDVDFVLDQLRRAFDEEKGDVKGLWSNDIEGLMQHVSEGFPGIDFYVRGRGEEFSDIWLRLFREGKIVFSAGPFEGEFDRAMRRSRRESK